MKGGRASFIPQDKLEPNRKDPLSYGGEQDLSRRVSFLPSLSRRSVIPNRKSSHWLAQERPSLNRRSINRQGVLTRQQSMRNKMFQKPKEKPTIWVLFSWFVSCCFPSRLLKGWGVASPSSQQAWREKWALCFIAALLMILTAFYLLAFSNLVCPATAAAGSIPVNVFGGVVIYGAMYKSSSMTPPYNTLFEQFDGSIGGVDVSEVFGYPNIPACRAPDVRNFAFANFQSTCQASNTCLNLTSLVQNQGLQKYTTLRGSANQTINLSPIPSYSWTDVRNRKFVAAGISVLNFQPYFNAFPVAIPNDPVDKFMRLAQSLNDATHAMAANPDLIKENVKNCLLQKYNAGVLSVLPTACIISRIISWSTSFVILGIMFAKFGMALVFDWFTSRKLSKTPDSFSEETLKNSDDPFAQASDPMGIQQFKRKKSTSHLGLAVTRKSPASYTPEHNPSDIYTMLMVTCYSEGEASVIGTLDSLAATEYDDSKKLLFVVCDGLVKGQDNEKTTPDILLSLLNPDKTFGKPLAQSYVAVGSGKKQINMAKVYCGTYHYQGRAIPMILLVKCGSPDEESDPKPGNRGKRDSQLILMNFVSRVTMNDRMTPLDFDIFQKIHHISGVTPDLFESVLMVDADTCVEQHCLRYFTNALYNDPLIIGLCGETRITNKKESWVTMIQVFEYFISHQMGKAFESLFGSVTCLPGCFSMWRITAQSKDGLLMPILGNPDILEQYSVNEVYTLHQKNLLLLGEDRFLTTIMLKTFPNRRTVYVPQAVCKTLVPSDFNTLRSQRRRWINSTIHNLMELALVDTLCGTFCFSMQFVVLMDLLSTAVLPAGLLATYVLIFSAIFQVQYSADNLTGIIMTVTMGIVIFLPAFLVILTGKKIKYIGWMMIYLLSLPVWQVILPLYSFWNFDDFSWGETRKVEGEEVDKSGHAEDGGLLTSTVPMKRWEEFEKERRQFILNMNSRKNR